MDYTHEAPLSIGFSRQEDWSRLPFPSPRHHPDPGIEPESPALASELFTIVPPALRGYYWNNLDNRFETPKSYSNLKILVIDYSYWFDAYHRFDDEFWE